MTDQESPALRTTVLPDFVRRLAALDVAAWDRMAARTPELSGDSAHALLARAATLADGMPPGIPQPFRAVAGFFQAVGAEFRMPVRDRGPHPRIAAGTDRPDRRRMADAFIELRRMIRAHQQTHPGVVASIEAVMGSLIDPRMLPLPERERLYAVLEPEIPFGSLIRDQWPPAPPAPVPPAPPPPAPPSPSPAPPAPPAEPPPPPSADVPLA